MSMLGDGSRGMSVLLTGLVCSFNVTSLLTLPAEAVEWSLCLVFLTSFPLFSFLLFVSFLPKTSTRSNITKRGGWRRDSVQVPVREGPEVTEPGPKGSPPSPRAPVSHWRSPAGGS